MVARLAHIAVNCDDDGPTRSFYEALFDWRFEPWGPPGFARAVIPPAHEVVAALQYPRRELEPGLHLTGPEVSIEVDDLTAVLERVDELRGRVVMPRSTIPTVGDLAFLADPSGNVIGVIEYAR